MKNIYGIIALLFASALATQMAAGATLKVIIDGISKTDGVIQIILFNSEGEWLKNGVRAEKASPVTPSTEVTFVGLPAGEYGVYVHDDVNNNGKLDKGMFGKPKEPYGFSNNSGGMFGPAEWSEAKLVLSETDMEIHIQVK